VAASSRRDLFRSDLKLILARCRYSASPEARSALSVEENGSKEPLILNGRRGQPPFGGHALFLNFCSKRQGSSQSAQATRACEFIHSVSACSGITKSLPSALRLNCNLNLLFKRQARVRLRVDVAEGPRQWFLRRIRRVLAYELMWVHWVRCQYKEAAIRLAAKYPRQALRVARLRTTSHKYPARQVRLRGVPQFRQLEKIASETRARERMLLDYKLYLQTEFCLSDQSQLTCSCLMEGPAPSFYYL
jgi:hypothetical protein